MKRAKTLRSVLVIVEMSLPVQQGSFLLAASLPFFPSQDYLTCFSCSCCGVGLKAACAGHPVPLACVLALAVPVSHSLFWFSLECL